MQLNNSTVELHWQRWKIRDLRNQVRDLRKLEWKLTRWQPRPALIDMKGGSASLFRGQKFDPTKTRLDPKGWTHNHCEICSWNLYESDDSQHRSGYGARYLDLHRMLQEAGAAEVARPNVFIKEKVERKEISRCRAQAE